MTTQAKNWFSRNAFNVIVTILLSIITFGGREVYFFFIEFVQEQQKLNKELVEKTERNESAFTLIEAVDKTNEIQGTKILENSERSIRNEQDIKNLKEDK